MPTYNVVVAQGRLSPEAKGRVAAAITKTHHEVTAAPLYFAQVVFYETKPENHFVGGIQLTDDHIFLHGNIRGGRTQAEKRVLLEKLITVVSEASGIHRTSVWIYLLDLPPTQMAEFGHVLPNPGDEAMWMDALPEPDRLKMQRTGLTTN